MQHKNQFTWLACALIALTFGCVKVDTPPQLGVLVLDERTKPVSGAWVGLFENMEEWGKLESPVQAWRQTGADGKVLFSDLKEITYYIYVRFDGMDNSTGEISLAEPLRINQRNEVVVTIR